MLSDLVFNDIYMSTKYIKENNLILDKENVFCISNNVMSSYLEKVINSLNKTNDRKYSYTIFPTPKDILKKENSIYIYFFDNKNDDIDELENTLRLLLDLKNVKFLLLSKIEDFSPITKLEALCEMELSVLLENSKLNSVENLLRKYQNDISIIELRYTNLFGVNTKDDIDIFSLCKNIESTMNIEISRDDEYLSFSILSIPDMVISIFTALCNGKKGNIYNLSSYTTTNSEIKKYLFNLLSKYGVSLDLTNGVASFSQKHNKALSNGKIQGLGFTPCTDIKSSLMYAFMAHLDPKFDILQVYYDQCYEGKLEYIREIELGALKELDKICRENDIQYFLSAGSMLGAVRNGGYIPWDDDVDVAMTRDEFTKFRKVAKRQIEGDYFYQTWENKNGYHYFFDRVMHKYSYYCTKYSDDYDMQKGISLDIFVFDKTSDNPFFAKLHYIRLMALRRIMNVRWKNKARKGKMYFLSKLLLPILRLWSLDSMSKHYEKATRAYEKKDTNSVLIPANDEKYVGSMPYSWFTSVIPVKFENIDTFLPSGYDGFLKLWYNEDYLDMLPICERKPVHDYYRLDLGKTINKLSKLEFDKSGELIQTFKELTK